LRTGAIFTFIFILVSHLLPDPEKIFPQIPGFITMGILPLAIWLLVFYLFIKVLNHKLRLTMFEKIQSLITFLVSAYLIFSIVGIYFRGPGMELLWPWQF
jgi:hypothetical protein